MRILISCFGSFWDPLYRGGGTISAHEWATHLTKRGHRVRAIFMPPAPPAPGEVPDVAYELISVVCPRASFDAISGASAVWRALRDEPADIVHASGSEGALLGPITRGRAAFLTTTHYPELLPIRPQLDLRWWRRTLRERQVRRAMYEEWLAGRFARRFVVNSAFMARRVHTEYGVPRRRIRVVSCAVDADTFRDVRWDRRVPGRVLFVGRFSTQKGIDLLLQAVAALRPRLGITCQIVGDGPERERLLDLCAALGLEDTVQFLPWAGQATIRSLLEEASVFAVASRGDSFGIAVAEAMAAGVPVVSTHVGGVPEVVVDGETGLLVPPEDPSSLATAIERLLVDRALASRFGEAGYKRAHRRFTWDRSAERLEQIYREVLAE